jgi:hypothetical protein
MNFKWSGRGKKQRKVVCCSFKKTFDYEMRSNYNKKRYNRLQKWIKDSVEGGRVLLRGTRGVFYKFKMKFDPNDP